MTPEDMLRRLTSSEPDERRIALTIAAKLRWRMLTSHIVDVLHHDRDGDVRAAAAWALDLLGDPSTVPDLVQSLYDEQFGVRSNAGWALVHLARRISARLVVPDVVEVLRDKQHPDARQMAYLILLRIHDAEARQAIERYWDG